MEQLSGTGTSARQEKVPAQNGAPSNRSSTSDAACSRIHAGMKRSLKTRTGRG